jgi:MFS family permease
MFVPAPGGHRGPVPIKRSDVSSASSGSAAPRPAEDRHDAPGQLTGPVVVVALVSAVSGMLYGHDTGIISGALLQITEDFGLARSWEQVIAASILLGAVIGALVCSRLSERRGRRGTLVLLAVVLVVGALWCAFSPDALVLAPGRLVLGFAVGGATQTAPCTWPSWRLRGSGAGSCSASRSRSGWAS